MWDVNKPLKLAALVFVTSLWGKSVSGQQISTIALTSGGEQREYLLYVPEQYDGSPLPLVFSFHGSGGVPRDQINTSEFDTLADQHGFFVAYPAGAFTNSVSERSWNANVEEGVDDVQFTRDMITDIAARVNVDRSRIYTSGFSGGARMSSRLACELSDVLAAAAPVAGLQYPIGCIPERAIPLISFHAEDDSINHYDLTEGGRPYWRMGVETALDEWRQVNDCSLKNAASEISDVVTSYTWSDCSDDAEIVFYHADTGGHTWPGSSYPGSNMDISASELIWDFFSRHTLDKN